MKKFIFFAAIAALFLASCAKEPQITQEQASYVKVIDEDTALRNFSVALSKAVCSEQSVREFLKKEALKHAEFGLLAQELETILPNLVYTDDDGRKLVDYISLIPVLIDAVQSLQAEVEELKSNQK